MLTRAVGASQVVEQACPLAQQAGVRAGLSLGQAHALVRGLAARPHEPIRDNAALNRIARWLTRFSPLVEAHPPNTLLIDITGCQRLFRGEANLAGRAVYGLRRAGFFARAAVADTVGAAWALATAAVEPLIVAPPQQTSAWLAPLPPAALRLDAATAARLDALGVRSISDLLMLPRSLLPARFGPQIVLRLQQALGETYEGVATRPDDDAPQARIPLDPPTLNRGVVQHAADAALGQLFAQLATRGLSLRRIECMLSYARAAPRTFAIELVRTSHDPGHVGGLLARRLEQIALPGADDDALLDGFAAEHGVCGLTLTARRTTRRRARQIELFEPRRPDEDEALGALVDRLVEQLGCQAVLRPRLVDDHQPEMAVRWAPVSEAGLKHESDRAPLLGERRISRAGAALATQPPPRAQRGPHDSASARSTDAREQATPTRARPARLFRRPVPIRVVSLAPDGPPAWFVWGVREHRVLWAHGPERIETAWWRGPDVCRDYYRVSTDRGEHFWVFRTLGKGEWFLQGIFV